MANVASSNSATPQDIRLISTQKIWSYATGMLGLCLIFSPLRSNLFLPIVVLSGAAGGTACIWRSEKESQTLIQQQKLDQIEQRLRNLETIASSDINLNPHPKSTEPNSHIC